MNIDECIYEDEFKINVDCHGFNRFTTYKYSINKYNEYISSDENKIHRLNNKTYTSEEKNVFELIYLLKKYAQEDKYFYFSFTLNTYWDKPFVEFD
jgi:hypothetical protein